MAIAKKRSSRRKNVWSTMRQVLLPHAENGYHPPIIRSYGLAIVITLAFGLYLIADMPQAGSVKGAAAEISKQELLAESNRARSQNNLPALKLDDSLNSAAGLKARDMLVRQYWSHNAPDGTTPWFWFREVNYRYDYAGENLAKGFRSPSGVVTAWMNSDEHRKNALNKDYQEVGFGIVDGELNGEQTTIIVALYGSRLGAQSLAESEVLAAEDGQTSLIARFGVGLQSLSPPILGSIVLLLGVAVIALAAYIFRGKVPATVHKRWKRHHALYKFMALSVLILVMITLYGGGQIL